MDRGLYHRDFTLAVRAPQLRRAARAAPVLPPHGAVAKRRKIKTLRVRTIRTKLLVYGGVVLVAPTILYGVLAYITARAELAPALGTELANDTASAKVAVQELLAGQIQNVRTWARLDAMRAIAEPRPSLSASAALNELVQDYDVFLDIYAIDTAGVCRASSWNRQLGRSYADQSEALVQPDGRPRPRVMYSAEHEAFYIGLAQTIPDPNDPRRSIGTLVAMLDRAVLDGLVQPQPGHGNVDLFLLDGERRILAGPRRAYVRDELPVWHADLPPVESVSDANVPYTATSSDGERLIVSQIGFDAHRSLPALDWAIVASLPQRIAFAPVRSVRNRIFLFGSVVTAIGLVLARLLSTNLVRPIKDLTEITTRIAEGGVLEKIPAPSSEDEIAELTRSFQAMVENVSAAHQEVIQSSKLAFLGELAAGIAHEIRTPLGIIKNSAQLLERSAEAAGEHENAEFACFIREESDRLNATVNELLSFARPTQLETEPVDVNRLVVRAEHFLESETERKRIRLSMRLDPDLPEVTCDGRQIYQVVLNLVMNAIQACEPGGTVTVETGSEGEGVACTVEDDGGGINPEILDQLFMPFVSKRKGGIGLGLAIVKRIVTAHGGTIDGTNRAAGGARFKVWLPQHAAIHVPPEHAAVRGGSRG